jgi:hypothetical protein
MRQLTTDRLNLISGGNSLIPIMNVVIPYQGEPTFTDGFWNGAAATAPTLGFVVGSFAAIVLYPLDLLGYVDIQSHIPKKVKTDN